MSICQNLGQTQVVRDLSMQVAEGEFLALLSPSGCGKSTTLRGIAMVFQSYALFPHLTVAQNITFGLSVRGESRRAHAGRLARVAPLLGLEKLLDRPPRSSRGASSNGSRLGAR